MDDTNVLFAGFGGHGMLLAGKILAMAAMREGYSVSWLPSYGAEMRGGTANVTVCVSSGQVASPYVARPRNLVAMNTPSLERFGPLVKPGGVVVMNTTLIKEPWKRDDLRVVPVDAGSLAAACGSMKATNFVLLGAVVASVSIVSPQAVVEVIRDEFAAKAKFLDMNTRAFLCGVAAVEQPGVDLDERRAGVAMQEETYA